MKKNILLIILTIIVSLNINSQEINTKKIIDLNLSTDLNDLRKVGYGERELKILSIILVDRANKNQNIDTLTIENCLPLIKEHSLYSNDFFKKINLPNDYSKRDSLISYNDLIILDKIVNIDNGIILFCSSGSYNCDKFLTDLNSSDGIDFLKRNKLYYYDLLKNEKLIERQKELLNSNAQPHFAIIKNGEIIKDFIGYRNLTELIDKCNDKY